MSYRSALAVILVSALLMGACTRTAVAPPSTVVAQPTADTTTTEALASTTTGLQTTSTTVVTTTTDGSTTTTIPSATTTTSTAPPADSEEPQEELHPLSIPVGTCFDDPDPRVEIVTNDDLATIDCSVPHDNEVFFNTELEGSEFPGESEVQASADQVCHSAFEDYVGEPYESSVFDFSSYFPSAESWEVGAKTVICFGYDANLEKLTGSIKGITE